MPPSERLERADESDADPMLTTLITDHVPVLLFVIVAVVLLGARFLPEANPAPAGLAGASRATLGRYLGAVLSGA